MRRKIVAGNWKMNKNLPESVELLKEIVSSESLARKIKNDPLLQVVVIPPFTSLYTCSNAMAQYDRFFTGAQNCHHELSGAYTGEISVSMISSAGARFIVTGHSERRQYFAESNELLRQKTLRILEAGLTPIFCCGEKLDERESGNHYNIVEKQLTESLFGLGESLFARLVIAYEPVWAIGTGRTATPEQAQDMHSYIRKLIAGRYGAALAASTPLLYGGSCNAANASTLFSLEDVDGGLIGGASLKAADFLTIIESMP
jgi:triosephosphate isomerase (TIM)